MPAVAASPTFSGPERRAAARFGPRPGVAVDCRADKAGPNVAVALLDVSARGCQVCVTSSLAPGQTVGLTILTPAGTAVRRACVVARAQQRNEAAYSAGLTFDIPLPYSELALVAHSRPDRSVQAGRPTVAPGTIEAGTTPEDIAARLVTFAPGESGDGHHSVRLAAPGCPAVVLGPFPNPTIARDELAAVRRFVAAAIREAVSGDS